MCTLVIEGMIETTMQQESTTRISLCLRRMAQALAEDQQPARGLQMLSSILAERIGYRLFTVLILDHRSNRSWRCFSTHPDVYPIHGVKPIRTDSEFFVEVVHKGNPRLCVDRVACASAFADWDLIQTLGCESAINVPVRWNGQTIAAMNLLHTANWYRQTMVAELALYAACSIPLIQHILQTKNAEEV